MADKIFVNGLFSKEIPASTPEFILGKLSIKVEDLFYWLRENKGLADEKGWINLTILRGKTSGLRYIEVDTWKPTPKVESPVPVVEPTTAWYAGELEDTTNIPF